MRRIGISLMLMLSACDMGHLGNPVTGPVAAVGSGIENATYNARRKRVSGHVATHYTAIVADIRGGGGPALTTGVGLARVAAVKRADLIRTLYSDIAKFTPDTPEARERLVVWLMVHGG